MKPDEYKMTTKTLEVVLSLFLFLYPILYFQLSDTNAIDSWFFIRYAALIFIFIFSILSIKNSKPSLILLFFISINIILALIQLVNPFEDTPVLNLYGLADRADGILYQILLMSLAFLAFGVIKKLQNFDFLFIPLILAGIFQSVLIFFQYRQINLHFLETFVPYNADSVLGFMGHSGYLGGFYISIITLNIYYTQSKTALYARMAYISLPINCLGMSLVQNRSSVVSAVFIILIYLLTQIKNPRVILLSITSAFMIYFGASVIPQSKQLATKNLLSLTTAFTRFEIWNIGIQLLPQSWLFPFWGGGVGEFKRLISEKLPPIELFKFYQKEYKWQPLSEIESYKILSDKNTPKRDKMFTVFWKDKHYTIQNISLDKAHNFFLDKAFSIGLLGAILWMVFYLYPLYAFIRLPIYQRSPELIALTTTLIGIQIYYIFWFAVMQVEPIHVTLAIATWIALDRAKAIPNPAIHGFNSSTTPPPQSLEA